MTLREKIADWISGGSLSSAFAALKMMEKYRDEFHAEESSHGVTLKYCIERGNALRAIAALETPNMAHVGKKAVKLAKEGLGDE